MITEERLAEIEARAEAATSGPWELVVYSTAELEVVNLKQQHVSFHARSRQGAANGKFIRDAIKVIPDLVAEVRRLRKELENERRTK